MVTSEHVSLIWQAWNNIFTRTALIWVKWQACTVKTTAELDELLLDLISWAQLKTLLKSPGTNYIEEYKMRYNPFNGHTLWLLLLTGTLYMTSLPLLLLKIKANSSTHIWATKAPKFWSANVAQSHFPKQYRHSQVEMFHLSHWDWDMLTLYQISVHITSLHFSFSLDTPCFTEPVLLLCWSKQKQWLYILGSLETR